MTGGIVTVMAIMMNPMKNVMASGKTHQCHHQQGQYQAGAYAGTEAIIFPRIRWISTHRLIPLIGKNVDFQAEPVPIRVKQTQRIT